MSLERLAGPFPLKNYLSNTDAIGPGFFGPAAWVDPVGLRFEALNRRYLTVLDGTTFDLGDSNADDSYPLSLVLLGAVENNPLQGQPWYASVQVENTNTWKVRALDRALLTGWDTLATDGAGSYASARARVHDRWLEIRSTGVFSAPFGVADMTLECALPAVTTANFFVSWGDNLGELWVGNQDGWVLCYDYLNKSIKGLRYRLGEQDRLCGLYYSRKHKVFVSIRKPTSGPLTMSVWATTPVPQSISPPTVLAGLVAPGWATRVRTQVLDSEGLPCSGEAVTWALVGKGTLLNGTTATDSQGYAYNQLLVPLDAGDGFTTITVGVPLP